ncbi:MAG: sigma-70 family RNA polymerase sigma factor [Chloroflexi bacterium]|nr:sigma-70 family RNA polymerase sigma factor [Chloroflexota bacterium]
MVSDVIVARAVDGDGEAFQSIVVCYEPRIYRFLYGIVRDRELAQDLTQETFASAFSAIQKTDGNLKLSAWLYTIAKNHAFSELRRKRLISWLPLFRPRGKAKEEVEELALRSTAGPADDLVTRQMLREALAKLDTESRTMLLLTVEGFSYVEIGQMMGLTVPAVRQRIFRARERLGELRRNWEDQYE